MYTRKRRIAVLGVLLLFLMPIVFASCSPNIENPSAGGEDPGYTENGSSDGETENGGDEETETERIYRIYSEMSDRYTLDKVAEVKDREIDPSALNRAAYRADVFPSVKKAKAAYVESETDGETGEEETREPELREWEIMQNHIISEFNLLKDLMEEDFEKYCKKYHPLKLGDENNYARIQINEELQELELSLKSGNSYVFYTGFYFDRDCNRHLDYQEGYIFSIQMIAVGLAEQDNVFSYPCLIDDYMYWEGFGFGWENSEIGSEADWEEYDVRQAYTSLKYPYWKHVYSSEASVLIGLNVNAFPQQEEFRNRIDETLYSEKIVGSFSLDGLNFHGQDISAEINGDRLTIADETYKITASSKKLFTLDSCRLVMGITKKEIIRELLNDTDYRETAVIERCYYILSTEMNLVEDGVEFVLNGELLLSEPYFVAEDYRYSEYKTYDREMPLYEELWYEDGLKSGISYAYLRSDGSVLPLAELPN